jgi:two-component system sensor histidine kinase DesK
MVGVAASYAAMGLLWPMIGANGAGFLIYAGSFSGTQRSLWPAMFTVTTSIAVSLALGLRGEINWLTVAIMVLFTAMSAVLNNQVYQEMLSRTALHRSQEEVARIAKIAERERIARDLHDLLGHTLSVIVLKSELASKLAERDPARATREIREIERIARESLQEVRSAVRGYRSTGLEGELAGVSLACEAAQIKLETYITPLELEWAAEQTLAFVLREAVTNAIRHANAKHLWVGLERVGDRARLSVWDDGSGRITEGNGLRGMRERLEFVGGALEINADHKGVTALLPLKPPEEARSLASGVGLEGAS